MKKFKRVVVFGCSCSYGFDLDDPDSSFNEVADPGIRYLKNKQYRLNHVYGKLVADYFGAELDMFACPAASIGHMRWQAQNWLEQTADVSDSLILAGFTEASRESWFFSDYATSFMKHDANFNKHVHNNSISHNYVDERLDPQWVDLYKKWLLLSHCEEWERYNFQQTVLFLDGLAKLHDIEAFHFYMLPNQYKSNSKNFWNDEDMITKLKKVGRNITNGQHPNTTDHKMISDWIIAELKNRYD
jgi:phospholipase/lecithinase/hemolysin